jgi:hypothetical protein
MPLVARISAKPRTTPLDVLHRHGQFEHGRGYEGRRSSGHPALVPQEDVIENINCEPSNDYSEDLGRQASHRKAVPLTEMGRRKSVGSHHVTHADHCKDYETSGS